MGGNKMNDLKVVIDDLNEQDFSNTSIKITLTSTENGVKLMLR